MDKIIIGFFTLLASLSSIWLNDRIDRKKTMELTVKQKAMETYILTDELLYTLNWTEVICASLIQNHDFDYSQLDKNYPDTTFDVLKKLEYLIVENFSEFFEDLSKCRKIMLAQFNYLLEIRRNIHNKEFTIQEFNDKKEEFVNNIILARSELKDKLFAQYIKVDKPHPNIRNWFHSIWNFIVKFFQKAS